ncbi:glycosyltransferase family 4 protein [Chondromyces apiculatus]|nr:glycosyltransferase family 4 protein [Chondromyces apiculatus]
MSGAPLTVLLHGDPRATQQARLGAALHGRGHRVILCDAPVVAAQIREHYGAACEEIRVRRALLPEPVERLWAGKQVRTLGVDVVHLNFIRPWHTIWSRMRGGPPYVATAWGTDLNDEVYPKPPEVARKLTHVLEHASALTADCAPLLEKAKRRHGQHGAPEVPSGIVLWGVDLETFDAEKAQAGAAAWRERLQIPAGKQVVLSPRQPKVHYHVDRIARAFAASRFREAGVLVIKLYGRKEEAEDHARLARLVAELGIAEVTRFAPACPYQELPALYAMADVAVSALEVDGGPSTFCELLALGVPLVATDLPAYQGLIAHEDRALLVPPGDEGAMVKAFDRLAGDQEVAARLRVRGMAWARETADWEVCVDRFVDMYRAAIAHSARGAAGVAA